MAIRTQEEIAAAMTRAGWPTWAIAPMLEVIQGESGFNDRAHASKGEDSWGLFQINRKAWNISIADATDLDKSASFALKIWKTPRGWWHWTVARNKGYPIGQGKPIGPFWYVPGYDKWKQSVKLPPNVDKLLGMMMVIASLAVIAVGMKELRSNRKTII